MSIFRKQFYENGKNSFDPHFIESDPSTWPVEFLAIYYKEYPRFAHISLPTPPRNSELHELSATRRSDRELKNEPLSLLELSEILKYSCGEFIDEKGTPHRAYPSGGMRCPVEAYVLVFSGSPELPQGPYHYNVRNHTLERITAHKDTPLTPRDLVISPWMENASALIVLTGVFWRSEIKYRGRGAWYTYLEAGAIMQNVHLFSKHVGVKSVSAGGVWDDRLESVLRLDPAHETPLHAIALGR